jgi:hypothetical protein
MSAGLFWKSLDNRSQKVTQQEMQDLADRLAITDLIYRYCRSVDRLDIPLGRAIWHEDAVADYGENTYQGDGRSVIDHICAQHLHTLHHSHQISNIIIDLDGDRAGTESYVTATLRVKAGGALQQITVWGRYIDQWSRRGGRWGIDKRVTIIDFDEVRDVPSSGTYDRGRRDHGDPSYTALRNLV